MNSPADEPELLPLLHSETPFAGRVFSVRRDRFRYGDDDLVREYTTHPGAVAVIALDDEDRVLLIRQYRHPVRLREWELPAGLMDAAGESPLATAQRELAEEVDLKAARWDLLTEFAPSPGSSDEHVRVFLARTLQATEPFRRTGEEADLELRWLPLEEAADAVLQRRIGNAIACVGLLAAQALRARGWDGLGAADTPWPRRESAPGVGGG